MNDVRDIPPEAPDFHVASGSRPPGRRLFPAERAAALADKFERATRRERWLSVLLILAIELFIVAVLMFAYRRTIHFGGDPPAQGTQQGPASEAGVAGR